MGDVAARLPPQYRTVGVRAFAPAHLACRLRLAWLLQLLLSADPPPRTSRTV